MMSLLFPHGPRELDKIGLAHDSLSLAPGTHNNYLQFYLPDERGQEMWECARVWRIYNEEAHKADAALIEGCNRNIDVLLVFTGLFSAVLTTFAVQSYSVMAPSEEDRTNALLSHLIQMQPNFDGTALAATLNSVDSTPATHIQWVNGFWFAALACSLSAALISMLAKQWLQVLTPQTSGSPLLTARLRQEKCARFESWHVLTVINSLPMLLHVALFLFFIGLIILLWPFPAITIPIAVIVGLVYALYAGSMWYSMVDPHCPYQHAISWQFHSLFRTNPSTRKSWERTLLNQEDTVQFINLPNIPISPEHELEAGIFIWMMNSPNNDVVVAALQAMSALPRDFTATQLLRDADVLSHLQRGFKNCFQRDSSLESQWKVMDKESAEKYCRAWMRLTAGTQEHWPFALRDALHALKTMPDCPDVTIIASCLWAVTFLRSLPAQLDVIYALDNLSAGKLQISQETECWLIDSITECSFNWELSVAQIDHIKRKATSALLRRLLSHETSLELKVRNASAVALNSLTGGIVSPYIFKSEDSRLDNYTELVIRALSVILPDPERYGVKEELFDKAVCEVARLASPIFGNIRRFKPELKGIVRLSLSELYLAGRIKGLDIEENALTDVLQLLYPPTSISVSQHPLFVSTLLETLQACSSNTGVVLATVRLLETLLDHCRLPVIQAFIEGNGINILLRTANAGADSRKLELDCLRPLFYLIDSLALLRIQEKTDDGPTQSAVDEVFRSNFFNSITALVSSPNWWSPDVPQIWLPTLVNLCQTRPSDPAWPYVVVAFQKCASNNDTESQILRMMSDINVIQGLQEGRTIAT